MMRLTAYSEFRADLNRALDEVCTNSRPLLVERPNGDPVIVMSAADFTALEETAYLLRSPANARRLFGALHGDRAKDTAFSSVDALRAEIGRRS